MTVQIQAFMEVQRLLLSKRADVKPKQTDRN